MRRSFDKAIQLREAVERGLDNNQFELYFQPIAAAAPGKPPVLEALLRWHHPTDGLVTPLAFSTVFNDANTAWKIGNYVMDQTVHAARKLADQGVSFERIAFNVANADFRDTSFVARLIDRCEAHNVPLERLIVEVTENLVLGAETQNVTTALTHLRRKGVQIALDDFGTGYASLSHLRSLKFDKIKIDKSFVTELTTSTGDATIVQSVVNIAASLNKEVIAEGVETEAQARCLVQMGCDWLQGWHFSRAVPLCNLSDTLTGLEADWPE
ncbi:EAL domain-containing protein [Pelagibacterium montanilacus]|uniref:EAL domain-containing protein n=1 Tax=Pelagibacterium montanilacus TaxID=2185280 RepID=UPI000F8C465E|nr:EAL domain-containing protein [Pelagibacterium montanilacus]